MFGIYENFPEIYHGVAHFFYDRSTKELQRTIIYTLYRLNLGKKNLRFTRSKKLNMKAMLEFGIADGVTFNYIDQETLRQCEERLFEQAFSTLDFLCIARYYIRIKERDKPKPLRFDYYILRFLFYGEEVEFRVFHEKGTQRLSIEDLITILTKKINRELEKREIAPLNMNYLRAL